jgi:hypothetical protein
VHSFALKKYMPIFQRTGQQQNPKNDDDITQKKGGLFKTPPQVLAIKIRYSSQKRLRNSESEIHGVPNLT